MVLITTKSANRDRPTINFSAGVDIAQKYKEIEVLDFDEWKDYVVALGNNYDHIYKKYPSDYEIEELQGEFKLDENGERIINVKPVNWQDYLTRTSISQRYYLSIAGRPKREKLPVKEVKYTPADLKKLKEPAVIDVTGGDVPLITQPMTLEIFSIAGSST